MKTKQSEQNLERDSKQNHERDSEQNAERERDSEQEVKALQQRSGQAAGPTLGPEEPGENGWTTMTSSRGMY